MSQKERFNALQKELKSFLINPEIGGTLAEWHSEGKEDWRGFIFSGESGNEATTVIDGESYTLPVLDYYSDHVNKDFENILKKHGAAWDWNDPGTAIIYFEDL